MKWTCRLLLSGVFALLSTSALANSNGEIGLSFDAGGEKCIDQIPCSASGRVYVHAILKGASVGGITGVTMGAEQINLIVCNLPGAPMLLFANANLDRVERIMIDCTACDRDATDYSEIVAQLGERGFDARSSDNVLMFERVESTLRKPVETRYCEDRASGF